MRVHLYLATFCLALAQADNTRSKPAVIEAPDANGFGLTGRIVNGTKAVQGQFPHQISLRRTYSSRHFCGGALVTSSHVLTAGHCMYLDGVKIQPWTILVVGGDLKLGKPSASGQRRGVETYAVHPNFDLATLTNDIAIVILKVPFLMTPELHSALFPTGPPVPGTVCQVAGWGYPAEDIPITNNDLMYVDLPILSREVCSSLLVNVTPLMPGMYCAGYLEGGKDACQGDSGGGMVCNGVITGIISGGEGCAHPRLPGVYSDVYHYRDWLLLYLEQPVYTLERMGNTADHRAVSIVAICLPLLLALLRS